MFTIGVRNKIRVPETLINLFPELLDDATLMNPTYTQLNRYASGNKRTIINFIEPKLRFYEYTENRNYLFPVGFLFQIERKLKANGLEYKLVDERFSNPIYDWQFIKPVELRDVQKEALDKILEYGGGVAILPTSAGKTILALALLTKIKESALITVPTTRLLYQWKRRVLDYLGVEAGLVGAGHKDIKPITIGIVNSVVKVANEVWNNFGCIIVDENKYTGNKTHQTILYTLNSKWRLGMTADPIRSDGLEPTLYFFCGRKLIEKSYQDIKDHMTYPDIDIVESPFDIAEEDIPKRDIIIDKDNNELNREALISTEVMKLITGDAERNKLVLKKVEEYAVEGNRILVLSDRISHLKVLKDGLTKSIKSSILYSKTSDVEAEKIIEEIEKEDMVVFTTYQMFELGIDIPALNILILATPRKRIKQAVGRIVRQCEGKIEAVIVDIVDKFYMCQNLFRSRKVLYKELYPNINWRKFYGKTDGLTT